MTGLEYPLPTITPDSGRYWESTRAHAIALQRCSDCGAFRFYPGPVCGDCGNTSFTWQPISGRGTVYSYTVVYKAAVPAFADLVPFVLVLVTLDEGPTMMSQLLESSTATPRIGMQVQVDYHDVTETITLPVFRPCLSA